MISSIKKFLRRQVLRQLKKMTFLPSKIYAKYSYEYFTGKKLNLENFNKVDKFIKKINLM